MKIFCQAKQISICVAAIWWSEVESAHNGVGSAFMAHMKPINSILECHSVPEPRC